MDTFHHSQDPTPGSSRPTTVPSATVRAAKAKPRGAAKAGVKRQSTIRDVARRSGTSISTVSRVLNDHPSGASVPPDLRKQILAHAQAVSYVPNVNARRVFNRQSKVLGIVVPSHFELNMHVFEDRHLAGMMSGVETGISGSGYRLMLVFNDEDFLRRGENLSLIQSQCVDGLLVWGAQSKEAALWEEAVEARLPVMFVCTTPWRAERCSHVMHATRESTGMMMQSLYERGTREFWYDARLDTDESTVFPTPEMKASLSRSVFLAREMKAALTLFQRSHADISLEALDIYSLAANGLARKKAGAGAGAATPVIVAYNYTMAEMASKALATLGVRVPEEVEIVSLYAYRSRRNWITTVEVDDFEMGRRAVEGLRSLMADPRRIVQIQTPFRLVQGKTTRA